MKGKDGKVVMSDHEKELLEKRRKFAQLILDGMSIAEAGRIAGFSQDYIIKAKKNFEEPQIRAGKSKTDKDAIKAQQLVDDYFASCTVEYMTDENGNQMLDSKKCPIVKSWKKPTVTGLALALGFATRESFRQAMLSANGRYALVLTRAYSRIEEAHEENLYNPGSTGSIFALKNIAGWTDKQEVKQDIVADVSTKIEKLDESLEKRIRSVSAQVLDADSRPAFEDENAEDNER